MNTANWLERYIRDRGAVTVKAVYAAGKKIGLSRAEIKRARRWHGKYISTEIWGGERLMEVGSVRESSIEKYLVRKVKEHGGLCFKFVSPGNPGVPDRIVITPAGKVIFVELKTEIGRMARVQKWQRSELEKRGADVRVLYGMDGVKEFLREVFTDAVHPA